MLSEIELRNQIPHEGFPINIQVCLWFSLNGEYKISTGEFELIVVISLLGKFPFSGLDIIILGNSLSSKFSLSSLCIIIFVTSDCFKMATCGPIDQYSSMESWNLSSEYHFRENSHYRSSASPFLKFDFQTNSSYPALASSFPENHFQENSSFQASISSILEYRFQANSCYRASASSFVEFCF